MQIFLSKRALTEKVVSVNDGEGVGLHLRWVYQKFG